MTPDLSAASIYTNFQGLNSLKLAAKNNAPGAARAVAKQFEALFVQMMLKSMREATGTNPLFDSQQTSIYRDMYDKQLALNISEKGKGIGLADMLMKQLQSLPEFRDPKKAAHVSEHDFTVPKRGVSGTAVSVATKSGTSNSTKATTSVSDIGSSPETFVRKLWPLAKRAAQKIGASAEALIAQAALETGWGKSVIRHSDGSSSHNLFNIKADERWHGQTAAKPTVEYHQGVASKQVAQFRSYKSYSDSFNDYVQFLESNPRYEQALAVASNPQRFVQSLQHAGYATDPEYANKLNEIMSRSTITDALSTLKNGAGGTLT